MTEGPDDQAAARLAKRAVELAVQAAAALRAQQFASALRLTRESAACYQSLAVAGGLSDVLGLAAQFYNEMIICRKTGQLAEAIRAGEEAVGPWRRVAAADHDYQASLAATLEDLSGCYARVGRWADARRTSAEAIVLYGRLVQGDPQRFALNLALNLANNSVQHEHLREYDSALVASQEAVSILRRRALADPASVEANLVDAAGDAD